MKFETDVTLTPTISFHVFLSHFATVLYMGSSVIRTSAHVFFYHCYLFLTLALVPMLRIEVLGCLTEPRNV